MNSAKRRLTIWPGQVSLVFDIRYAEEVYKTLSENVNFLPENERMRVQRFLAKIESAISTGRRLTSKQSAFDRGNI